MKIMLIDDQAIANLILTKLIKAKRPEVEITEYTRATDALDALSTEEPDLIFLDINMPQMNGWDFLEKMPADNQASVAMLTSSTSQQDALKANEYPQVSNYFIKPLGMETVHNDLDQFMHQNQDRANITAS